jgi:G3E family GTPase
VVPFIILTGFLGSGKTTLLNCLLAMRQAEGTPAKIGLIVNELGAIGVDGDLLPQSESRQVELPGGCVCCVLSDDLAKTIVDMLDRTPELEAILLESTGVAEPLPIAWALERPPAAERVRLAAVITLVDATCFLASRPLSPAVDAQVAYSDVLLLTKSAIVSEETRLTTEAAVRTLAPRVELRTGSTQEHAAWLHTILSDPHFDTAATGRTHAHEHDHDHVATPSPQHLLESVATMLPDTLVDLEELEDQLAALPASYVRIKGILRAIDGRRADSTPGWYAFHRVGLRVSSEPLARPASPRVVALGRNLDIEAVRECIDNAVVT